MTEPGRPAPSGRPACHGSRRTSAGPDRGCAGCPATRSMSPCAICGGTLRRAPLRRCRHDATPVRFGILGCASIARRSMAPVLASDPSVRLVAVASRTAERAGMLAGCLGAEAVHGYQRLLDRQDIEAVYVPLPTGLHAEWIA